jgi:hypothetical protein
MNTYKIKFKLSIPALGVSTEAEKEENIEAVSEEAALLTLRQWVGHNGGRVNRVLSVNGRAV